jgi:hypothetical protein
MRTLKTFYVFVSVFVFANTGQVVMAFSGAGTGTQTNPYQITNISQLQEINNDLDARYVLANDIDASDTINWNNGEGFVPIGNIQPFIGTFDGQNHTITDLYIKSSSNSGLFGQTTYSSIKNVGLINININVSDEEVYAIGGLIGVNDTGTITNSYVTGTISGTRYIGGLVGMNYLGEIANSYTTVSIYGSQNDEGTGGLVGFDAGGRIYNSHATGNINGSGYVGGLIGKYLGSTSTGLVEGLNIAEIRNSYATGNVTNYTNSGATGGLVGENTDGYLYNVYSTGNVSGKVSVGGLVGSNSFGRIANAYSTGDVNGNDGFCIGGLVGSSTDGYIIYSYTTGNVTGGKTGWIGGLAGYIQSGLRTTITSSYWDVNTTGQSSSAGVEGNATSSGLGSITGGEGKTTSQMKKQSTFIGWNFVNTWMINEGVDYPRFKNIWQKSPILPVSIDIRPGSHLNLLNIDDEAILPVSVYFISISANVNALNIDSASIRLNDVAPVSSSYIAIQPQIGIYELIVYFNVQDIVAALGTVTERDKIELTLTGKLNDGTGIQGKDSITIITNDK